MNIEKIKRYLNIENNDNDNFFEILLSAVIKKIDNYINQNIQAAENTLYFNGNGSVYYIIPYFPVNSVTSLHYRTAPNEAWTELTNNTDFYLANKGTILTEIYYEMGYCYKYEYKLVFNSGYTTLPADVELIIYQMFKIAYDESVPGKDLLGVSTVTENKLNISVATQHIDLTPRFQRDLAPYRIPVI